MNPLILSLIGLVTVGVSANLIKLIRKNKILLLIAIIPCVYIFIYGLYATFGPIDLYKDGTENFIAQNPGKELPIVFVLLKFYQYILILVGAIFGLIKASLITSVIKKGSVPNHIVWRGVFCMTPLITNKFIPTGGEINPNSTTITANIPNHTGSIPASTITG